MQASREDAKHDEERRALSNSPLSTNVVETVRELKMMNMIWWN